MSNNTTNTTDFSFSTVTEHIANKAQSGNTRNGSSLKSLLKVTWTMAKSVPVLTNTAVRATAQVADYIDEVSQGSEVYTSIQDTPILSSLSNSTYENIKASISADTKAVTGHFKSDRSIEDIEL